MLDKMFGKIRRVPMLANDQVDGVIVINKPRGVTSFDVVAKVRRAIGQKKVGHAGTLDPDVSGVLVVALGKATKLIDELQSRPKRYVGDITLGFATETEDLSGEIISEKAITVPYSDQQIDEAIQSLNGSIQQVPPMYSAVKVAGKRLYEYARAGETVTRPIREAHIYDFHRTSLVNYAHQQQKFDFEATVSKGTYIRTLAVDTGRQLGMPATMTRLERVMGSGMTLSQAIELNDVMTWPRTAILEKVIPISKLLNWPIKPLTDDEWFAVKNGQVITQWPADDNYLQLTYQDEVKAVYAYNQNTGEWRSRYVFNNK